MIFSPRLMQRLNQRTSCVATDDFFNTIHLNQTLCKTWGETKELHRIVHRSDPAEGATCGDAVKAENSEEAAHDKA